MKIYIGDGINPLMGVVRKNDLPFHFERNRWEFVSNIHDADVVPILKGPVMDGDYSFSMEDQLNIIKPYKEKIFLLMMHGHITETMGQSCVNGYLREYQEFKNLYVVSVNLTPEEKQISYNYYYNWVKAHFTEYTRHDLQIGRQWVSNCSRDSFKLPVIKEFNASKKFCIPNYVRPVNQMHFDEFKNFARDELSKNLDPNDSYYSDFRKNIQLLPEESSLYPGSYRGTENGSTGVGIIPIANTYFTDSIVSVFVESVASKKPDHKVLAFTEKTYIPLVKGHFILPFGSPGLVAELKKQGFMFPNWIDYSYDLIENDNERLKAFLKSFKKLQKMKLEDLNNSANQDLYMRKHNRNNIMKSKFDSLYEKVNNLDR